MAEKDGTERRVYNLPVELLERLRAYQVANGVSSEVEAARRLLDSALQMRDTVFNLLAKLEARLATEKDYRILARDILIAHPLVTQVSLADGELQFIMTTKFGGRIQTDGTLMFQYPDDNGEYWHSYSSYVAKQALAAKKKPTGAWDSKPLDIDLDDEIPF